MDYFVAWQIDYPNTFSICVEFFIWYIEPNLTCIQAVFLGFLDVKDTCAI